MTVREFYEETGGDYDEVLARLKTDERIIKFAKMFAEDKSYQVLVRSLETENMDGAFRAAHTIKGMCQNMAFRRLFVSANEITERLRAGEFDGAKEMIGKVTEDYNLVVEGIRRLIESDS